MNKDYTILFYDFEEFDPADINYKPIDRNDCNLDVEIRFNDERRCSGTIFTLKNIERILKEFEEERENYGDGECLNGKYFHCPDMIIVRKYYKEDVRSIIEDIISSGRVKTALKLLEENG